VLKSRLTGRKSEDQAKLLVRLRNARAELGEVGRYHYVVVNDNLERAVDQVSAIIDAEGLRHDRVHEVEAQVEGLIAQLEQEIHVFSKGD
jgi:guanylate kinase